MNEEQQLSWKLKRETNRTSSSYFSSFDISIVLKGKEEEEKKPHAPTGLNNVNLTLHMAWLKNGTKPNHHNLANSMVVKAQSSNFPCHKNSQEHKSFQPRVFTNFFFPSTHEVATRKLKVNRPLIAANGNKIRKKKKNVCF